MAAVGCSAAIAIPVLHLRELLNLGGTLAGKDNAVIVEAFAIAWTLAVLLAIGLPSWRGEPVSVTTDAAAVRFRYRTGYEVAFRWSDPTWELDLHDARGQGRRGQVGGPAALWVAKRVGPARSRRLPSSQLSTLTVEAFEGILGAARERGVHVGVGQSWTGGEKELNLTTMFVIRGGLLPG